MSSSREREQLLRGVAQAARAAARVVAKAPAEQRTHALRQIASAIETLRPVILAANAKDVAPAEAAKTAPAMVDRLRLDDKRIAALVRAVNEIADQPEVLGRVERTETRPGSTCRACASRSA